jgi:flagellar protein FlgJ
MRLTAVDPSPPDIAAREQRRLTDAVRQLEGVFVEQLFKAMRNTVPDDGIVSGGAGEAMFTSLMDQQLADVAAGQWSSTIREALLREFQQGSPALPARPVTPGESA